MARHTTVQMKGDKLPQVLKGLKAIANRRVLVGVPGDVPERKPEGDEPPSIMNNPTLLYIHENGSPARNIPARPTVGPGIEDARERIGDRLGKTALALLSGREVDVDVQLHATGLIAQASIRKRFGGDDLAPLAPMTLENRRARGRKGERPLVDTGQLRNAINYVVMDGNTQTGEGDYGTQPGSPMVSKGKSRARA